MHRYSNKCVYSFPKIIIIAHAVKRFYDIWHRFREKGPLRIHYKISSKRNRNIMLALKCMAD